MTDVNDIVRRKAVGLQALSDIETSAQIARAQLQAMFAHPAVRDSAPMLFGDFRFGARSIERMIGVHPDMRAVAHYAIRMSPVDFGVTRTGGLRSPALQQQLTAAGKSRAKHPRHVTGHALDIAPLDPATGRYTAEPRHAIAIHDAFVIASHALAVPLRWGGDWDGDGDIRERGENDLVHHELPRRVYGNNKGSMSPAAAAFLASLDGAA